MPTNNSGRLPSADCSTPVAPGPSHSPTCSVACPTNVASAASATAETANVSTALACAEVRIPASTLAATATATVARSRYPSTPKKHLKPSAVSYQLSASPCRQLSTI